MSSWEEYSTCLPRGTLVSDEGIYVMLDTFCKDIFLVALLKSKKYVCMSVLSSACMCFCPVFVKALRYMSGILPCCNTDGRKCFIIIVISRSFPTSELGDRRTGDNSPTIWSVLLSYSRLVMLLCYWILNYFLSVNKWMYYQLDRLLNML